MIKKIALYAFTRVCRRMEGSYLTRFKSIGYIYGKVFYSLKPSKVSLETVGGNKMYLNLADNTSARMYMFALDKPIINLLEESLKKGGIFFDVGAHVGYFTLRAAKLVGPEGRIFAFEPENKNHELLVKNVEINGHKNVVVKKTCVSDRTGKISLYLKDDSGTHSTKLKSGKRVSCLSTTLDGFCRKNRIPRIDFIKMDIEGGESAAFDGMTQIAKKSKTLKLVVEFVPSYIKDAGGTPQEFMQKLSSMGFRKFSVIDEKSIRPASKEKICSLKNDIYNILAEK